MPGPRARRPLVFGHRGASARAPENTLSAFALALDEGADGFELDVRLSRDGVVVVVHDPDLRRLARREEAVASLTAAELGRIDVGGDTIPTLERVLELSGARDAVAHVELKGDVPDRLALGRAVAQVLRRTPGRVVVSSFRPELLVLVRTLGVRAPAAFLFDADHTGPLRAAFLRRAVLPSGLHPERRLCSPGAIARWHRRGLFVNAWTVNTPAEAVRLAAAGIDGLITDDPAGILRALAA